VLAKQGADLHANTFSQYLLDRFVREGHFTSHLEHMRQVYRRRCEAMVAALDRERTIDLDFEIPRGGFYVWCRISDGIDQAALLAAGAKAGVVFLPGRACFATEPQGNFLRLNFSHPSEEAIGVGVRRLLDAIAEASVLARPQDADGPTTSPVV
jgi:DNA-binding transcriptional MocR family regulator